MTTTGVVYTFILPSHECAAVTVDCILRLSGPVRLILRYTAPDIHCREAVRVRRWNGKSRGLVQDGECRVWSVSPAGSRGSLYNSQGKGKRGKALVTATSKRGATLFPSWQFQCSDFLYLQFELQVEISFDFAVKLLVILLVLYISLPSNENMAIMYSVVLSRYTHVLDRRQTDRL